MVLPEKQSTMISTHRPRDGKWDGVGFTVILSKSDFEETNKDLGLTEKRSASSTKAIATQWFQKNTGA
jgi:hypothetical protein